MSELRQDPTTREWVLIAPERATRPRDSHSLRRDRKLPEHDENCPFCPGNEARTTGETLRIPAENGGKPWQVRVVPNAFPALTPEGSDDTFDRGRLTKGIEGYGIHEVIIESPLHNTTLALMSFEEVEDVLAAWQQRFNAVKQDPLIKYITIFKNHGHESGTSLSHPHSQLLATPIMTPYYHRRYDVAVDYYSDTGRCLYCDVIHDELEGGVRIVAETAEFIVFHPWASRVPCETWIIPREHRASFGLLQPTHLTELSVVLKDSLQCLYRGLDDPAYNLMIDTTITGDEENPYYHWHIRIVPRLSMIAGFELGSGIYINTSVPEQTAKQVRETAASFPDGECDSLK